MRQNATRRRTEKARINTEVSVPITLTRPGRVEVASINVAAKAGNRHAASTLGVRACRMPKDDAGTPLMRHDVESRGAQGSFGEAAYRYGRRCVNRHYFHSSEPEGIRTQKRPAAFFYIIF
jgi:hypothetical protein